jgi:hypothetical protein
MFYVMTSAQKMVVCLFSRENASLEGQASLVPATKTLRSALYIEVNASTSFLITHSLTHLISAVSYAREQEQEQEQEEQEGRTRSTKREVIISTAQLRTPNVGS